jgi:YbgC/YbaW family acyl-CoA thioester hydrolase
MPHTSIQVRVPFPDVDSSGRIHFAAMLRYMEQAEHELMRSLGFPYARLFPAIALPRVHVACDFRAAVRYDDRLTITARVEHVGRSSWNVAFTAHALHETDSGTLETGELVADGQMTIVSVDVQTERSRPLPEDIRAALAGP